MLMFSYKSGKQLIWPIIRVYGTAILHAMLSCISVRCGEVYLFTVGNGCKWLGSDVNVLVCFIKKAPLCGAKNYIIVTN